jgi:hypothetical protein
MNTATISSKVTFSLVSTLDRKEKRPSPSQESKDFVGDILSQVVRMEFFGSKTSPCKNPADKTLNGKFYTVPVKFMFKDRKTAKLQLTFYVSSWESIPQPPTTRLSGLQ